MLLPCLQNEEQALAVISSKYFCIFPLWPNKVCRTCSGVYKMGAHQIFVVADFFSTHPLLLRFTALRASCSA